MKSTSKWATLIILSFLSCDKSSDTAPPTPVTDNEFIATVSVEGATPYNFLAKDNATLFHKRYEDTNGDTVIVAVGSVANAPGSDRNAQIALTFINITKPGNYIFSTNDSLRQVAFCDYSIGNPLIKMYSTSSKNGHGTFTIDSISTSFIRGTFLATCTSEGKIVQITAGSFKGSWE